MENIFCDLHIHSIASGHAFNTIDEIVRFSEKSDYRVIGISEHGPDMEGAPHSGYFEMLYRLPKAYGKLKVLYGCEANILDCAGKLDLDDSILAGLDYIIAGLHSKTSYKGNCTEEHTDAIVNAIRSGRVNIISHPVAPRFIPDVKAVVEAAKDHDVFLEANKNVMLSAIREQNIEVLTAYNELFHLAERDGVGIIFGSDAHHISEIKLTSIEYGMIVGNYNVNLNDLVNFSLASVWDNLKRPKYREDVCSERKKSMCNSGGKQ